MADASKPTIFDVSSASARINLWLSASLDLSKEGLVSNPDDLLDSTNQKTDDTGSYRNQANPGQQMQMQKRHISPEGSAMNRSAERPLLGKDFVSLAMKCICVKLWSVHCLVDVDFYSPTLKK